MAMLHNLKVYLGLGPDEEYDDSYLDTDYSEDGFEEEGHREPAPAREEFGVSSVRPTRRANQPEPEEGSVGTVRPIRPVGYDSEPPRVDSPRAESPRAARTQRPFRDSAVGDVPSVVRPVLVGRSKPVAVEPSSFSDAKEIADEFKAGTPVVMNMVGLPNDLSRRLIDFASGVCYIQSGSMEKLARGVFLLIPKGASVSDEEKRRLEDRGYRR